MKRIIALTAGCLLALCLTGCPMNTSQLQQTATALDNTSIVVKDAQQAEIAAVNNGLIPPSDDLFIQQELTALSLLGKTTDACVLSAGNSAATLTCIKSELTTMNQMQTDGALALKSDKAKSTFAVVMNSATAVVNGVYTALGGK
jgi:hypothetical protein